MGEKKGKTWRKNILNMKNRSTCTSSRKHPGAILQFSFFHKLHFYQQEKNEAKWPSRCALPLNLFSVSHKASVIIQIAPQAATLSWEPWQVCLHKGVWKKGVAGTELHFLWCTCSTLQLSDMTGSPQAQHSFILKGVFSQLYFTHTINTKTHGRELAPSGTVKNLSTPQPRLLPIPIQQ